MTELYPWYLLYCKRSEQERAEQHLLRQGVECYSPLVSVEKIRRGKLSAKLEPLFPNYIFITFDPKTITFTTIRSTRGVANFVRTGSEPCKVPLELIASLMAKEDNQEQRERLKDIYIEGDLVEITAGPFIGTEAIYKESDGELRAILLINMLNKQVEISQDNSQIRRR